MPSFEQPIQTEDIREHDRLLRMRLDEIQLIYAERKFNERTEKNPNVTFSDFLQEHTYLIDEIRDHSSENSSSDGLATETEARIVDICEKINAFFVKGGENWKYAVIDIIDNERQNCQKCKLHKETERAGLIKYDLREHSDNLEAAGIDRWDTALEIHLNEPYKHPEEKLAPQQLKEWLGQIAVQIVAKYPQVRAVIGTSWLMDTNLAKKFGFNIAEKEISQKYLSTWMQFVDKDGQVDKKKLDEFIKTGNLPHQARLGYMSVENFLQKFLPQDKRGQEITLREIPTEWKEKQKQFVAEVESFKQKWPNISVNDIESALYSLPTLKQMFDAVNMTAKLLDILEKMKQSGLSWEEATKQERTALTEISNALDDYAKEHGFVDKKLNF